MNKAFTVKKRSILIGLLTAIFSGCLVGLVVNSAPYMSAGAETKTESPADAPAEGKNIKSVAVTLNEDIVIKYYVNVSADYTAPAAAFTFNGTEYSKTEGTLVSAAAGTADAVYEFTFDGVTPQYLGIPVDMVVSAVKTGETAETEIAGVTNYSVRTYCEKLLEKTPEELGYTREKYDSLRALVVDLLNYGAAAQTYTGTEGELVNAGLTADEKALATGFEAPSVGEAEFGAAVANQIAEWKSAGLVCDSKIAMYFKITAPTVSDAAPYTMKIGGTELSLKKSEPAAGEEGKTVYTYYYTSISLTRFDQAYTAQLFDGETPISNTITYSVHNYIANTCNDTNEQNVALIKAIYSYGKAAVAYKNAGALDYTVETAPAEHEEGVLKATYGGYTYTKKIPSLSADFENGFRYYEYIGTSLSENGAVGAFRLRSDSGYGTLSFTTNVDSYVVTAFQDGENWLTVHHSIYDISRLNSNLVGSVEAGISVITLTENVTLDNMSLQGKAWKIDSTLDSANEGYTLTVNDSWELKASTTIGANAAVKPISGENGVNLYASQLRIDGKLIIETPENGQWKSGVLYGAENVSVTVNGTFTSTNRGIGVYMNNANNSFVVNAGANVTVETAYGHAFVGNGAGNALTITGGETTFKASESNANAVLCQNDSLEIQVKGGSFTTTGNVGANTVRVSGGKMNLESNRATYSLRNLSVTGGDVVLNNTLTSEKTVIKGGTLTITSNGTAAIKSMGTNCRYYFIGGETLFTNNGSSDSIAAVASEIFGSSLAITIGGIAKVEAIGFAQGFSGGFGVNISTYQFTKYLAGSENDYGFRYKNSAEGEASPLADANGFDFWGTISDPTYWVKAGIAVNSIDEISGKPLSAENAAGAVDFANL